MIDIFLVGAPIALAFIVGVLVMAALYLLGAEIDYRFGGAWGIAYVLALLFVALSFIFGMAING